MSALLETPAPARLEGRRRQFALPGHPLLWPSLAALASAIAFYVVRPNVGDLQAALARQSAADHGVGLSYWFSWYGGGATPGNYSVVTPYLSSLIGAAMVGVVATVLITPLVYRAAAGTRYRSGATWIATITCGISLWSGRVPFAVGLAVAVISIIGVRERRPVVAVVGIVVSSLCSPVTGAFLAFGLVTAFLVERDYRRLIFWTLGGCGVTLLAILLYFGNPGSQGYAIGPAGEVVGAALLLLIARPAPGLRIMLWCTAAIAPLLTLFPNGMGSNFARLPEVCLPAAVLATATVSRRVLIALAVIPAMAVGLGATTLDLVRSRDVSAKSSYYTPLIGQLGQVRGLDNFRLEVVQDPKVHTAAYVLVSHVALAGGYETQEQNEVNSILSDPARLNAISYKLWLDNNAVGYVALSRESGSGPEYALVRNHLPTYLVQVSQDRQWTLYRVEDPTPIVPAPARLITAKQASLTVDVPCACTLPLRIRYSKFLSAVSPDGKLTAVLADDGTGWTTITTTVAGRYVLSGDLTQPLH